MADPNYQKLPWKTRKRYDDAHGKGVAKEMQGTGVGTWLYNKFSGNKKEINETNE